MNKIFVFFIIIMTVTLCACKATVQKPENLICPPGTTTNNSVTLLWDKPQEYGNVKEYGIFMDVKCIGTSPITNFKVENLQSQTSYSFYIIAIDKTGNKSKGGNSITVTTKKKGEVFNIVDFGAVADGKFVNTWAIQKAVDACTEGGVVYIPEGTFLSGAFFLKSDMTLYISKNGILKGTTNIKDYEPMIRNRFEGWELDTYSSLINAGKLSKDNDYNVKNISIRGEGKIIGGGTKLGNAMIEANGLRRRGRLICLRNCINVNINGITVEELPCWTIHFIYSKNVTINDITINSFVRNGDGIDPDSSTDCYIFNCTFSNGDDCIAIKSGKNPEGYYIGKPTENVFISNCNFIEGHGISIGSEMSGGIRNVEIRDCKSGNLKYGMQINGTKDRGGFMEDIRVLDCELLKITIFTRLPYNNDGEAAPKLPIFKNFNFQNIDMRKASIIKPVIEIHGFEKPENYTNNIVFQNITLPDNATVSIENGKNIEFKEVEGISGHKPLYIIKQSQDIRN